MADTVNLFVAADQVHRVDVGVHRKFYKSCAAHRSEMLQDSRFPAACGSYQNTGPLLVDGEEQRFNDWQEQRIDSATLMTMMLYQGISF